MKKYILISLCMIIALNICGCTTSLTIGNVNDEDIISTQTDATEKDSILKIDLDEAIGKTKEKVQSNIIYNCIDYCSIEVNEVNKEIQFAIIVEDNTSLDVVEKTSAKVIRDLNDYVYENNNTIKKSDEYYLGEIYDVYDIKIAVSTDENQKNSDNWYVLDKIQRGLQINPTLQEKYRIKLDEY